MFYFRHETQPKQCEIHVSKFQIEQNYSTMFLIPYTPFYVPPKASLSIFNRFWDMKKFEKLGIIFDMKLNKNNVKYN